MKLMHSHHQSQRGSILIESLVAILLFSLGILAFVGQQASAIKYIADSRYRTEAAVWADNVVAEMQLYPQNLICADYSAGGVMFNNWQNKITAAGTGLPGANNITITLTDASSGAAATPCAATDRFLNAIVTVGWSVSGNEKLYAGDTLGGTYTTNTTFYLGTLP